MSDKPIEDGFPEAAFDKWLWNAEIDESRNERDCAEWGFAEGLKAGKADAVKLLNAVQNYLKERDTAFPDYVKLMQRRKELGRVIQAFDKGRGDGTA